MNLLNILTPLYLLITLGYLLKKYQFPNPEFWPGIERMIYYILFPTLILVALMRAQIDFSLIGKIAIVTLIPTQLSGLVQWFGFVSAQINNKTFSSMYQGAVRNNTAIALVVAAWLIPDKGLAIMAVIILIMIPVNNLSSILILLRYGEPDHQVNTQWWRGIISNPLIIACFVGLVFNLLGIRLHQALLDTADFLGRSALPFALLAVGAGLKFNSIFQKKFAILLSSFAKLLLTPLVTWLLCQLLGVESDVAKIAIIFSAMPTAVSSYILARQMGGDAETMAQIITFQTVMSALTLPIFLILLNAL